MSRYRRLCGAALLCCALMPVAMSSSAGQCDQVCLHALTDRYLNSLTRHDTAKLPLSPTVKFTENGKALKLTEGLWKSATGVGSYREYFADPKTGNTLWVGVIDEGGSPAILAVRLKVAGGKISEIETVVARKGSHPLFSPQLLTQADPLFSSATLEETRVPRERMIELANLYFDGLEQNSSKAILATPDCDRYENGTKTTFRTPTSGNCAKSADAINYIKGVKNRRCFLVEEEIGIVACTVLFDIPGGDPLPPAPGAEAQLQTTLRQPRTLLLTEIFKIDGGNIARIQAVMHNLPHGGESGWKN